MSGTGDKAWRNSQHQRQPSSRSGTPGQRDGAGRQNRQSMGSQSGNAWHKGRPENITPQSRTTTPSAPATPTPAEEPHVPVNGYNADEVKAWMKKRFDAATTLPDGTKVPVYRPQMPGEANTPKAPWGKRPNQMADGRDFWVEFKKQITNLEAGK